MHTATMQALGLVIGTAGPRVQQLHVISRTAMRCLMEAVSTWPQWEGHCHWYIGLVIVVVVVVVVVFIVVDVVDVVVVVSVVAHFSSCCCCGLVDRRLLGEGWTSIAVRLGRAWRICGCMCRRGQG